MATTHFKTNLKCNGCIAAVKPSLDAIEGLTTWEVDLASPEKELTAEIDSEAVSEKIISAFKAAGYEASRK